MDKPQYVIEIEQNLGLESRHLPPDAWQFLSLTGVPVFSVKGIGNVVHSISRPSMREVQGLSEQEHKDRLAEIGRRNCDGVENSK